MVSMRVRFRRSTYNRDRHAEPRKKPQASRSGAFFFVFRELVLVQQPQRGSDVWLRCDNEEQGGEVYLPERDDGISW
jgi:hypothetical protein